MDDKLFDELLESVREGAAIIHGDSDKPYWSWQSETNTYVYKFKKKEIARIVDTEDMKKTAIFIYFDGSLYIEPCEDLYSAKLWVETQYIIHKD